MHVKKHFFTIFVEFLLELGACNWPSLGLAIAVSRVAVFVVECRYMLYDTKWDLLVQICILESALFPALPMFLGLPLFVAIFCFPTLLCLPCFLIPSPLVSLICIFLSFLTSFYFSFTFPSYAHPLFSLLPVTLRFLLLFLFTLRFFHRAFRPRVTVAPNQTESPVQIWLLHDLTNNRGD